MCGGELLPPDPPEHLQSILEEAKSDAVVIGDTSQRMTGAIAVGVIIVSGPGDLQFSQDEIQKVLVEVQNGLGWHAHQNAAAGITWYYDIHTVQINVPARPSAPANELEAIWRDPAMQSLGYGPGFAGIYKYIDDIKRALGTQWTYAAYFTKYPASWFAYASMGGPRVAMQYTNDTWGPDNIDRVFAHETGHIFQAPDEYEKACKCGGAYGVYNYENGNCARCPGGGAPCIMGSNDWSYCNWTPYHFGFPMLKFSRLAIGNGNGGNLQVAALRESDGSAYLAAWQDSKGGWNQGFRLPGQPSTFSQLVLARGNSDNLQLLGLGQRDGCAYLADWQDGSGNWNAGFTLPGQTTAFSQLVVARGNSDNLQVIGLGKSDGRAYLACWQDRGGSWHQGFALPGQPTAFSQLALGRGNGGNLQLIGLGKADGYAYLAGWQDSGGGWNPGFGLPGQSTSFSQLAMANGNGGNLQVVGLGQADGYAYLASWQDSRGGWNPGLGLPGQTVALSQLALANGNGGNLQVVGLGKADGHAYLASWQDSRGGWNSGPALPAETTAFSELMIGSGNSGNLQVLGVDKNGFVWLIVWQDSKGGWNPGFIVPGLSL